MMATSATIGQDEITLRDVIVTQDLDNRPVPESDHARVKAAIQDLAAKMVDSAEEVLPRFVDLAMELASGVAAGISVYEPAARPPVFRWAFLRGSLAAFEGATTPRDFSPCGVTLDRNQPTLARHAERYYSWIADANIVVPEVLLVPLQRARDEQLGTLWIVSDRTDHFNHAHARALTELASFVGIALRMLQTEARLKAALSEQEALAMEMSHRVKNVFNIVDGMILLSAKGATSKDELGRVLTGRVRALGKAHALVRRSFDDGEGVPQAADLRDLLQAIVSPHEAPVGRDARFSLKGPTVLMGPHATNGIALVFHELATNAAKYGALTNDVGGVEVDWTIEGADLRLQWRERGGPSIEGPPKMSGFGTQLVQETIGGSFGGTMRYDWKPGGLKVEVQFPLGRLRN